MKKKLTTTAMIQALLKEAYDHGWQCGKGAREYDQPKMSSMLLNGLMARMPTLDNESTMIPRLTERVEDLEALQLDQQKVDSARERVRTDEEAVEKRFAEIRVENRLNEERDKWADRMYEVARLLASGRTIEPIPTST